MHRCRRTLGSVAIVALYDEQCELCQASVSWIRVLDRRRRVTCLPVQGTDLALISPALDAEACLRTLHAVDDDGVVHTGWEAVRRVWSAVPVARPLLALTERHRGADRLGRRLAEVLLDSRWELVRVRGGRAHDHLEPRPITPLGPFWVCYSAELLLRLPLVAWATSRSFARQARDWASTRGRRVRLLDGRLEICFLGGPPTAAVPLVFGERFTMAVYRGVAVDPGSSRMRRSLAQHLAHLGQTIHTVVATHAHEEHVGNLDWLADRVGAAVRVGPETARLLQPPYRLPWWRAAVIGTIPELRRWSPLGDRVATDGGELLVLPAPGHCDDHVVFFDPVEGVLFAGDSFMGEHFATPNEDVDGDAWIATLERLQELEVSVLVEAHGHVHTLRPDIPDVPGVVLRRDPQAAIGRKLQNLRWLRDQVAVGRREGLSDRAVEATCYPWGPQWSWEHKGVDELARLFTGGRFSRTRVVRSFRERPGEVFPERLEVRFTPA